MSRIIFNIIFHTKFYIVCICVQEKLFSKFLKCTFTAFLIFIIILFTELRIVLLLEIINIENESRSHCRESHLNNK